MKTITIAILGILTSVPVLRADEYDLVVYGSSPAAISAAVQAKRMGLRAVIVSPEKRIGGLTTGGLGQTDAGVTWAFGGIAREFYRDVARHYARPESWTRQKATASWPMDRFCPAIS